MAPRKATGSPSKGGKAKKQKQPTQFAPQQRVMVLGPTGKRRFEWRPW
jgi:propanediol utilization protein